MHSIWSAIGVRRMHWGSVPRARRTIWNVWTTYRRGDFTLSARVWTKCLRRHRSWWERVTRRRGWIITRTHGRGHSLSRSMILSRWWQRCPLVRGLRMGIMTIGPVLARWVEPKNIAHIRTKFYAVICCGILARNALRIRAVRMIGRDRHVY